MYYRVANPNENIFEACSVEIAEKLNNISAEDIFEMYGVADEESLEDILPDELFFDPEGHFGAGLYYNGVCCCNSLDALKIYFGGNAEGLEASVIFVFEGEWMGSCNDGDVVIPTKLTETLSVEVLDEKMFDL